LYNNDGIWLDLNQNDKLEETEHFKSGDSITVDGQPIRIHIDSER